MRGPDPVSPLPQVPDLRRSAAHAPINLAIDDQPAADAGADRDVEHRGKTLARPEQRFGEPGDVGVVPEHRGKADQLADPVGEREIVPALDLMRLDDGVRAVIDGSAEPDANPAQLVPFTFSVRKQLRNGLRNLLTNATRTRAGG